MTSDRLLQPGPASPAAAGALPPAAESCRIVVDPEPALGVWNMAVDEALLGSAISEELCTTRWYRWAEPTISLGYFQAPAEIAGNSGLSRLPVVRRLSGGGAIVHHHELTYSCTIPARHPLARDPRQLYDAVHHRIIAVLARCGLPAALRGAAPGSHASAFLCFGRGDAFDVVIGRHKVLGSAQRRRKGAILQHGSLILACSEYAPEFPGLADVAPRGISESELLATLPEAVAGLFAEAGNIRRAPLSPGEVRDAESIVSRNRVSHDR